MSGVQYLRTSNPRVAMDVWSSIFTRGGQNTLFLGVIPGTIRHNTLPEVLLQRGHWVHITILRALILILSKGCSRAWKNSHVQEISQYGKA